MRSFNEYVARGKREHGSRFSSGALADKFVRYFENGKRIEVSFRDSAGVEYARKRGTVGVTSGWVPVFLLMLRSNSMGSIWALSDRDVILREIPEK